MEANCQIYIAIFPFPIHTGRFLRFFGRKTIYLTSHLYYPLFAAGMSSNIAPPTTHNQQFMKWKIKLWNFDGRSLLYKWNARPNHTMKFFFRRALLLGGHGSLCLKFQTIQQIELSQQNNILLLAAVRSFSKIYYHSHSTNQKCSIFNVMKIIGYHHFRFIAKLMIFLFTSNVNVRQWIFN